MVSTPVVDIEMDPLDERRRRRRVLLRIGIPLGGVALMIATILLIAFYADRANRDGALALSDDLLATLEQRIGIEVSAYLEPAARAVRILRDTLHDGALGDQLPLVETFASSLLREIPQIANLNFADENGNFVLVRGGRDGGIDVKLVENAPGPRRVIWIHRNTAGDEIGARRIRQTPTILVPDPGMSARSQTTNCSGPASISFSANAFPGSQHPPNTVTRVAGFTYSVSTSPWMRFRVFSGHSRSDELAGRSLWTIPESSLPLRRAAPRCARSTKNLPRRASTSSATRS
jgi:hypothetical protein